LVEMFIAWKDNNDYATRFNGYFLVIAGLTSCPSEYQSPVIAIIMSIITVHAEPNCSYNWKVN